MLTEWNNSSTTRWGFTSNPPFLSHITTIINIIIIKTTIIIIIIIIQKGGDLNQIYQLHLPDSESPLQDFIPSAEIHFFFKTNPVWNALENWVVKLCLYSERDFILSVSCSKQLPIENFLYLEMQMPMGSEQITFGLYLYFRREFFLPVFCSPHFTCTNKRIGNVEAITDRQTNKQNFNL